MLAEDLADHVLDVMNHLYENCFELSFCKEIFTDIFRIFYYYNKKSYDTIPKFLVRLILQLYSFATFPIDFNSKEIIICQRIAEALLNEINGNGCTVAYGYKMPDESVLEKTLFVWSKETETRFFEINIENFDIDPILAELHW